MKLVLTQNDDEYILVITVAKHNSANDKLFDRAGKETIDEHESS